jgi:hypothetical protein
MINRVVIFLLLFCNVFTYSYSSIGMGSNMPISEMMNPIQKYGVSDDKAIEQVQIMFLKNMFTDNIMKTKSVIFDEDDEEYMSMKAQTEMINDVMSYELARKLAKQDIMNMKPYFKTQGWLRDSSR